MAARRVAGAYSHKEFTMRFALNDSGQPALPAGRTTSPTQPNMKMVRAAGLASILGGHLRMEGTHEDLRNLGEWLNDCAHVLNVWGWGEPGWGDWEFHSISIVFNDDYPCTYSGQALAVFMHERQLAIAADVTPAKDAAFLEDCVAEFLAMFRTIIASLEALELGIDTYAHQMIINLKYAIGDSPKRGEY